MGLEIRTATPEDVPTIYQLIYALAISEGKAPGEIEANEARIRRYGFGEEKCFDCELAFMDGEIVGQAIYSFKLSPWKGAPALWMEDIFVLPEFRRRGIGRALFRRVCEIAAQKNCAFVEWPVFEWNEAGRAFYERIGATMRRDFIIYRFDTSRAAPKGR
jgi:GNAT superfamily N-acetyltransferase